jgi:hypothetical protein
MTELGRIVVFEHLLVRAETIRVDRLTGEESSGWSAGTIQAYATQQLIRQMVRRGLTILCGSEGQRGLWGQACFTSDGVDITACEPQPDQWQAQYWKSVAGRSWRIDYEGWPEATEALTVMQFVEDQRTGIWIRGWWTIAGWQVQTAVQLLVIPSRAESSRAGYNGLVHWIDAEVDPWIRRFADLPGLFLSLLDVLPASALPSRWKLQRFNGDGGYELAE